MLEDSEYSQFVVLVNDEGQHSLWPKRKAVPTGWQSCGIAGTKDECCKYIDENWTDMRPVSLRGVGPLK
jgi:MbtH protein